MNGAVRAGRRTGAVLAAALALAGCAAPGGGDGASRRAAAASADGWREVVSAAGTWRVAWRTEPSPVPLNEPFTVEVRVSRAAAGGPLAGVPVRVDAGMPHHQHGMNVVPVHGRASPEVVTAEGLVFHMPGAWTLTFDVTDGPITERAEVVVELP